MVSLLNSKRAYLPGLTGLRGVGAMWVLIYHAQYGLGIPLAEDGFLGVDLFFILSGFVLSHAHGRMRLDWPSYKAFVRDRFARIFPMHWAALLICGVVLLLYPKIYFDMPSRFQFQEFALSFFLTHNWGLGRLMGWNVPSWSLSTEWLVSLGFPLFLLFARRFTSKQAAVVGCAACLLAFAGFLYATHNPNPDVQARAGIIRTLLEFMCGCLLYRAYLAGVQVGAAAKALALALLVIGLSSPGRTMLAVFALPIVILLTTQRSLLTRLMVSPPFAFLGKVSFSIYLLHWILLQASDRIEASLGVHGWFALLWFGAYVALVLSLAAVTYRLVENPAREWIRGGFRLQPRPVPGGVQVER
jgi:peptidoglycan/LPS O-acetylase OafA/YrhL